MKPNPAVLHKLRLPDAIVGAGLVYPEPAEGPGPLSGSSSLRPLSALCDSALSFLFSSHRPVRKLIRKHRLPAPLRPSQRMRQRPNQFRILRRTPHRNPDRLR